MTDELRAFADEWARELNTAMVYAAGVYDGGAHRHGA